MDISPVTADLKDNLFYNPNKDSTLKHIEVTEDSVRLEFSNTDDVYRKYVTLFLGEKSDLQDKVQPWMIPVDVKNLMYCGGGATVVLDRRKISSFLKSVVNSKENRTVISYNEKKFLEVKE